MFFVLLSTQTSTTTATAIAAGVAQTSPYTIFFTVVCVLMLLGLIMYATLSKFEVKTNNDNLLPSDKDWDTSSRSAYEDSTL